VLDTQGSELLVLRGAEQTLSGTKYVKVEVADFEAYTGCCKVDDISAFLGARGFRETTRHEFARREGGGAYFDIVYQRRA
jgi:hypothetical protein